MPRGGKRAGAGRPKRGATTHAMREIMAIVADGISPLDVYRRTIPKLEEIADKTKDPKVYSKLLDASWKHRKLFHSEFSASDAQAKPHKDQGLPLFDGVPRPAAPLGKKELAEEAAQSAAQGSGWGDLLKTSVN